MQQKLVNINVEGTKHTDRVFAFIDQHKPTILTLQEAPLSFVTALESRGYQVTFVPLTMRQQADDTVAQEGLLLATTDTHTAAIHHYHDTGNELMQFDKLRYRETMRKAVILAAVTGMQIATTHFTWTADGSKPGQYQQKDIVSLLAILDAHKPHVLCGDLNIPRYYNSLYGQYLVPRYHDRVPKQYTSSLDPTLHRRANNPQKAHLFTDFMVDHLLTQDPLQADDVSLHFGISDHAAVVATLTQDNA